MRYDTDCLSKHREPKEGEFDFSGNFDLKAYITMAESLVLNVIVRPGPYICAEREFGGLPAWLLTYEKMVLRCNDPLFLSKLSRYLKTVLGKIRPHLASQGGNVIMLQIENEYGSYGNDKEYLRAIAKIYEEAGMDCLCFTADGPYYTMLSGGTLPEYLAVANFGSKPETYLSVLAEYRPERLSCAENIGAAGLTIGLKSIIQEVPRTSLRTLRASSVWVHPSAFICSTAVPISGL